MTDFSTMGQMPGYLKKGIKKKWFASSYFWLLLVVIFHSMDLYNPHKSTLLTAIDLQIASVDT